MVEQYGRDFQDRGEGKRIKRKEREGGREGGDRVSTLDSGG